ncbi:hypothetical protein FACS1894111_00690 [Clostridia bacterium]|nr:hypothetical protein FACS1894111_00690 [Clostridia bacterium]
MKTCNKCGAQSYRVESQFCQKCGERLPEVDNNLPKQNICTNENCEWHKSKFIYPDDARFCDVCGSPTVYAVS